MMSIDNMGGMGELFSPAQFHTRLLSAAFFLRTASTCRSDDRTRGLVFAGGRQLNSTKSCVYMPFRNMPRIGELACVEMKMVGKPYAGELHVLFGLMRGKV